MIALIGRESAGVKLHFAEEVGVDDSNRATRGALGGEMVQVGDLDPVQVK